MKLKLLTFIFLFITVISFSQATYVPDDNFENYLETHKADGTAVPFGNPDSMGNGIANDNYITTAKINTITHLNISSKNITSIVGIEDFVSLTHFYCYNNQLTNIDITSNVRLKSFFCYDNQITSLDLTQNTSLNWLYIYNNQLTTIEFTQNINYPLVGLRCQNNLLTSLNLSHFVNFRTFNCSNNQLTSLNVANGINHVYNQFVTSGNPNLNCITVDNNVWSSNNWTNIDTTTSFANDCHSGETYVPDDNFENYLETHNAQGTIVPFGDITSMGNQIANDNYVTTASINTVTNLDVSSKNIAYLNGIEDFVALVDLRCSINELTTLDVSQNINLNVLQTYQNQLTNLNVSLNTELRDLRCNNNLLTSLDVSQNNHLVRLYNYSNQINTLDVSLNTNLEYLYCSNNLISSLNVSQNTALTHLSCFSNQLTALDVNQNPNLAYLYCNYNQLTSLNLSLNPMLFRLHCFGNQLTSLNLKNGNNITIVNQNFKAQNNPDLMCIEVDNAIYSTTNWASIDTQSYFLASCSLNETYVPDNNFENYLETHNAQGAIVTLGDVTSMGNGIANDDYVYTARINTVSTLNVPDLDIADATGIEDFELLEVLNISKNLLTVLNLSQNSILTTLYCYANQITSLDLSMHSLFTALNCYSNNLHHLNVRNGNNQNVTEFEIGHNPDLRCVQVDEPAYSNGAWPNKDNQTFYDNDCGYLSTDVSKTLQFSLFPNPTKGKLTITPLEKVQLIVYSIIGKEIIKRDLNIGKNEITNLNLSKGFYVFKLVGKNKSSTKKVIVN
ncbi:T9SS type A sorting domain-containing protein [Polaribacter staleyi]|uniref:leucine-rich repeat domain-containing protein n=1 Tax=Polaribacter staleyi TaxID=2022337 RepID=UPI0031BAC5CA